MDDYAEAQRAISVIKENIRKDKVWILQRWAGWKPNDSCVGRREAVYETVPDLQLMSYDEMLVAQREISRKYPGQVFEGYRIIPKYEHK